MENHIVFMSGGRASFAVADYVKSTFPNDNILLYFTDTLWENEDSYRFIDEASNKLELPLLVHSAGLNPIQLMFEKKLVYNSRIGDCSKLLKIRVAADFLKKGVTPVIEYWRNKQYLKSEQFISGATLYFGISFEEMHREVSIVKNWAPFTVKMPLIEFPIDVDQSLKKYSIKQPELYNLGFGHNNCNGRCVKAGQGHYRNLKKRMPGVFKKIMEQEHHLKIYVSAYRYIKEMESDGRDGFTEDVRQKLLADLDDAYRDYFYDKAQKPKLYIHPTASATDQYMHIKQYSFMKVKNPDYVAPLYDDEGVMIHPGEGSKTIPYPLRDFYYDDESKPQQIDIFDIGGCGCFVEF